MKLLTGFHERDLAKVFQVSEAGNAKILKLIYCKQPVVLLVKGVWLGKREVEQVRGNDKD